MSDHLSWIVDQDATLEEAPALAAKAMQWMEEQGIATPSTQAEFGFSPATHGAGPNIRDWVEWQNDPGRDGIVAEVEHQVFHTGGNGIDGLECPECRALHSPDDVDWSTAVENWFEGQDDRLECPTCAKASSITAWRFTPLQWGFGNLGIGFDGIGPGQKLADAIGKLLGHRMVIVHQAN